MTVAWHRAEQRVAMPANGHTLPSMQRYEAHLRATIDWLLLSIEQGKGGSSAHYSPLRGWAAPYPETSGYIIPTLLEAAHHLHDPGLETHAEKLGEWLLALQHGDGWWPGGLLTNGAAVRPSVFNTAQILEGMVALARRTEDVRWHQAAASAAAWLASGVDAAGLWRQGNYRPGFNPSYYAQVAWPMLQAWQLLNHGQSREAAVRVLERVVALRTAQDTIADWGFEAGRPAFTHTIAYTLRGLIESALILNAWDAFAAPCMPAVEKMLRASELRNGRLPGAYHRDWHPVDWYSCLTGNVQIAVCLLRMEQRHPDLRVVNGAAKLVDFACAKQNLEQGRKAKRGAVAGSSPVWGRYMCMRYPNWAAKYHADALMALRDRLARELSVS